MVSESDQLRWDRAAEDYQKVFLLGLNDYNRNLLRFWQETGMIRPGCRVLDLGCGVGKYGTYLAELGCEVTLTDISPGMLQRAADNMANVRVPWSVHVCDFHEATGREAFFADGFDFSLSTMSPAVSDVPTVRKMSRLTRGFCFLARFRDWEQPLRDRLMLEAGLEPRRLFRDLQGDCDALVRAVREAGFLPEVRVVDYDWADERTPEQMADYLCRNYFPDETDSAGLRGTLLRLAEAHAGPSGTVTDAVHTRVAWIWWRAGGEPSRKTV